MKSKTSATGPTRSYQMTARAKAAAETAERILDAAMASFSTDLFDEVTLDSIAGAAGVTVQTVIRRFGSKEGLFAAVAERESARIVAERDPGSSDGATMGSAVRALVAHYESDGQTVLNLLRQEERFPLIAKAMAQGRQEHEKWVREQCAQTLGNTTGAQRRLRLEAAVAATDLYVWKLLRLDRGLTQGEVEKTMLMLLESLEKTTEGH